MKRAFVEQVMGLPVSVLLRGATARDGGPEAAVRRVYDELRVADAVFSTWRPDSEVSRLNRGELALADCRSEVREVDRMCQWARDATDGLFDADAPDGHWDPSGLVKGWAVERAARHLASLALDWCLNAGGDVLVSAPSGEPFGIGIADPHDRTGVVAVVRLVAGAVATSGTAARGDHLWHPQTGRAATGLASVTVAGASLTDVDVLATAAFVDGGLGLLGCRPDTSGFAVHPDGRQEATANWAGQALKVSALPADSRA